MTSTFHLYYTVVANSDLVNRESFQVEKVNMQNITKNNVKPPKSAIKLLRGSLWCYVFSIFSVFINLISNNVSFAIQSCSLVRLKMIIQESFSIFYSSMPINLNQYRETVGIFNNCKNIYCSSCNIYYSTANLQ